MICPIVLKFSLWRMNMVSKSYLDLAHRMHTVEASSYLLYCTRFRQIT